MDRLDYYDITPKGMDAYLASHGYHFSKPMLEWAVGMMRDQQGGKISVVEKQKLDEKLKAYGITLENDKGYYDAVYVWCMGKADYLGSSIIDENHLARFVKDYVDDKDGAKTRAFDEFYIKTVALGIDIPWEDMI